MSGLAGLLLLRAGTAQSTPDTAWEGPYTPIPPHFDPSNPNQHCCEVAHAILIGKPGPLQGKVLIIQSNGSRWIWDPAAPNSVENDTPCDNFVDNLFCAGHSADGEGNLVVHSGNRRVPAVTTQPPCPTNPCGPQPTWSYVFNPVDMCWVGSHSMLMPNPVPANFGYWYPGSLRLHDGRVLSAGGGSAPLTAFSTPNTCCDVPGPYFVDGWQIFDAGSWVGSGLSATPWFDGLPGVDQFNYYPLLMLVPGSPPHVAGGAAIGSVFAAVVTNNRVANNGQGGYTPFPSRSAIMSLNTPGWPAGGSWTIASQMVNPGTSTPLNLYYPNGFVKPLRLDAQGLPADPVEVVVLGGVDRNLADVQITVANVPFFTGGRPASDIAWTIPGPEQGGIWSQSSIPPMLHARIYSNAVVLPNEQVFVVGGSGFDFYPFGGGGPGVSGVSPERLAQPVFEPEIIDARDWSGWNPCFPHQSARLYHSIALLLPDARVLVGGGYQGKNIPGSGPPMTAEAANGDLPHSDFEIYNPDYLFSGPRPQLVNPPQTLGYYSGVQSQVELTVAKPGSTAPALEIESVVLVSCGSVTHHYDWDQRVCRLQHAASPTHPSTRIIVTPPASGMVAQPGYYMLFVNSIGEDGVTRVPSIGKFVKLH